MQLRAIDDDLSRQQALNLLREGFPSRSANFWLDAFDAKPGRHGHGVLLIKDDGAQGVLLLFERQRLINQQPKRLVNLSSWYVRESYRPLAFFMMREVVNDTDAVFTNFSATETAAKVAQALGFCYSSQGSVFTLPRPDRLLGAAGVRVRPFDARSLDGLDPNHAEWLKDHQRPLHFVFGIEDQQGLLPVVFRFLHSLHSRKRLARLIFCPDHARLAKVLPAVQRSMLWRHGVISLILPRLDVYTTLPGVIHRGAPSILVKGDLVDHEVDLLYSELTYLLSTGR